MSLRNVVADPLGALWPVIGILIEAIVLFLIIYIAKKLKTNKEKGVWNIIRNVIV